MKYPEMRGELVDCLLGLSDRQYQLDCWVNNVCPDGVQYDELDYAIHFLFDDTELATNAESLIGYILDNENEVILIKELCQNIQRVFDKYGTQLSDKDYISCPEWDDVLESAKVAYKRIAKPA
jgi:hypothetical protein